MNRPEPQAITARQALECYTRGSVYAKLLETEKGAIDPGMFANLPVLSEDPLSVDLGAIKDIQVTMAVVDGRTAYEAVECRR